MRQRKTLLPMSDRSLCEVPPAIGGSLSSIASKRKDTVHQIPAYFAFLVIALLCLLFGGVFLLDKSLPSAYKISDEENYPNAFIAERAQHILKGLTDIGPKVVGSHENEVEAVKYLNAEIDKIVNNAHSSFNITIDNQLSSGAYYLGFLPNGLINSYGNVQNIVVKVDGKNTNDSILINAHFDSVPTSPGACDDGIMVAVMLETLRKLTQNERQYERNIIFLFNGAEESPLQAAHGFITQHKWAETCKTIVNLEAAGHGGKAILFQSGPSRSSALMSHYKNVPYPYAQASGEEIFQSNLIPSDTDFRLFRDFRGLSGFDIAFAQNGYRYHTKYDNYQDLELGSYQHAGGNLLALVKSLATDPQPLGDDEDKVVYFDVFNWFIIVYSTLAAYIVNLIVALASVIVAITSARNLSIGFSLKGFLYVTFTTVAILGSWVCAACFTIALAFLIDWTEQTMTWFASPVVVFGLYVAPILGVITGVMILYNRFGIHHGKSLSTQSQVQMHLIRLIWTFVLFIGTLLHLRSVYVILIPVLFNTIASIIILALKWQHTVRKWQICAVIFTIIPTITSLYVTVEIFALFIPITGRMGANRNPELIIGMLTLLMVLLIASHFMSYIVLVKRQYSIPFVLCIAFVITFSVSMGKLQYSGDRNAPAPQRFMIYHTNRIHHNIITNDIEEQSGIFILNNDRNSPNSVKDYIDLSNPYNISSDCDKYPACGMPISSARMLATVEASTWIPFPKAKINEKIEMTFSDRILNENTRRYEFTVEGPDHLTVFIRPFKNTKIIRTSLVDLETDDLIFINHAYGKIKTDLIFSVDVQSENIHEPVMDFVVSGKYYNLNGQELIGEEFDDFIKKFPDWADVVPALANYESYVI